MRGTIDGTDIYLDDGQLPAFSSSSVGIEDPAQIKGAGSTTIRVVATKESARAIGTEFMRQVPIAGRLQITIGEDSASVFKADAVPVKKDRNEIELICLAGNSLWFEQARSTKIRDLDMGITDPLDASLITDTFDDEDNPIYFPLIDYGSFEGRSSTYDVPVTKFRPAIRFHSLLTKAMKDFGFRVRARGSLRDKWKKLALLDPEASPGVTIPVPYPVDEIFSTSNPAPDGYYFIPSADGIMTVECYQLEINYNPATTDFDAMQFRVVVYDFTARKRLASYDIPIVYFGDANYGAIKVDHTFTGVRVRSGNQIYVAIECLDVTEITPVTVATDTSWVEYNRDSGTQTLKLRPDNVDNIYGFIPDGLLGNYYEGYQLRVAHIAPDWTVSEMMTRMANAVCLAYDTDQSTRTVNIWFDHEFFRRHEPGSTFRDWTTRMDHTSAPAQKLISAPRNFTLKYDNDKSDEFIVMADRRSGVTNGYGSHVQENDVLFGTDKTITIPISPSINGKIFGGCYCPILRQQGAEYQEDNYGRTSRILITDGIASGTWKLDGVAQTEYPRCYFSAPDTPIPLAFDNATFDGSVHPVSKDGSWKRRLDVMRYSRILECNLFIRDHELQDFDHGMPTLVDDGSGPAWYWVQEIQQHRFGVNQPTKCLLVQIPTKEVELSTPQAAITYPAQPFACAGPGYVSFVRSGSSTSGDISLYTTSGYWSMRLPNGTITTFVSGAVYAPPDNLGGAYCVWSSDALGEPDGYTTDLYTGAGLGANEFVLRWLQSEGTLTIGFGADSALVDVDLTGLTNLIEFVADGSALSEDSVDAVINRMYASALAGAAVSYAELSGGTNAAPTAASATALAGLTNPANMVISATGNANVDGTYNDNGTTNGRSAYIHAGNGITEVTWTGSVWRIVAVGAILESSSDVAQPWLATGWSTIVGTASTPTIDPPGYGITVNTN